MRVNEGIHPYVDVEAEKKDADDKTQDLDIEMWGSHAAPNKHDALISTITKRHNRDTTLPPPK